MADKLVRCMSSWLTLTATAILSLLTAGFAQSPTKASPGDIHISGENRAGPPRIAFAADGSTSELESLFSQPNVISDLKTINAGIALSLPDLSPDRARIVRQLNSAGIPVTAWLTLPSEQGYYLNAGNAPEAAARFAAFQTWTSTYSLQWAAVGLDIEPGIHEFTSIRNSKSRLAWTLIKRYFDMERIQRARNSYSALIREIQAQGYPVETYQFPFLADERRARSTLLERLAGIVDVRGDREILMIYTSFRQQLDSALIWVYGPDAQAIAVGITNGPEAAPHFTRLNWEELSHDLIVASHFSHEVGVYNLAGCVQQGFLPRFKTMNWNQSVTISADSIRKATRFRARLQRAIWLVAHLPYLAAAIVIATTWILVRWIPVRRRKRKQLWTPSRTSQNPK
jgi:hypothetical protein